MNDDVLRYLRHVVMKAMDRIRSRMRGSDRLLLKNVVAGSEHRKHPSNLTKGVDAEAEDLIITSLLRKLPKMASVRNLAVFSEERGVVCERADMRPQDAEWVAFIDPVDGTEFIEALQGGWCLLALYDRKCDRVEAAVAGDIFLNRLYWASQDGPAECIDFVTHSWFKLDGGPNPRSTLDGARVNCLTTKPERYLAVASKPRFIEALGDSGRINLAWGSNMIVQVAAGYADAAVEFHKGFATYDILPGLFIGEKAGLCVLDLNGSTISSRVDIDSVFAAWEIDSKKPKRTRFVAAKHAALAREIIGLVR